MSTLTTHPQPRLSTGARRPRRKAAPAPDASREPWRDPGPAGRRLRLEDYPSAMLLRVANAIQHAMTSRYAQAHGVTASEWRLLARLSMSAPMQFADLCRLAQFDKAHASRLVKALQARKLLRTQVDPEHARRLIVHLTPEGRDAVAQVLPVARRSQAQLLAVLTPDERSVLYAALRKLQAHVEAGVPQPPSPRQRKAMR